MKRIIFSIVFLSLVITGISAQNPKREVRATWLTTVWRLDWPSATVPTATGNNETERERIRNAQKNGLLAILNRLQAGNFNTIYFQVRGMSDAFYNSQYEPWSAYISSERGQDPGWDPLEFIIEEAHKRGIEIHAWLNPYRYSTSTDSHGNLPTDYPNTHPDWLMDYGSDKKILNPGMPEVRERICDIVEDIITNYDVDGIIFDDYFYVQGTTNAMDNREYDMYNPNHLERGDWRRANVNLMVEEVYERINNIKPYLSFGISPAGVAASAASVAEKYGVNPAPVGSDWQYNGIYSDPLAWLNENTIDYISPQIYWAIKSYPNDYELLSRWWANIANHFGRNYYSSNLSEFSNNEIVNQTQVNRDADLNGTTGIVFFRTNDLHQPKINALKADLMSQKALTAKYGWKKAPTHGLVTNLNVSGQNVSWNYTDNNVRYVVYAIPNANRNDADAFTSPKYIVDVSYAKNFTLPTGISSSTHKIAVAVYDRFGNEFAPRVYGENTVTATTPQLTYPANNQDVVMPALFSWTPVSGAIYYVWEIAEDAAFNNPIQTRETPTNEFNSALLTSLKDDTRYYWRVKAIVPNAEIKTSAVNSFEGEKFKILSPEDGSSKLELTPTFTWKNIGSGSTYTLEISSRANFSSIDYSAITNQTSHTVASGNLAPSTTYYAQVKVSNSTMQAISERVTFFTKDLPIDVPTITGPADGSIVYGEEITLEWAQQSSKGFRAQLSASASFPTRNSKVIDTEHNEYNATFTKLTAGTYYLRVAAYEPEGLGNYSNHISVILKPTSSVEKTEENTLFSIAQHANGNWGLRIKDLASEQVNVKIYSVAGMLLSNSNYANQGAQQEIIIDNSLLNKGIYLIQVNTGQESRMMKIYKK